MRKRRKLLGSAVISIAAVAAQPGQAAESQKSGKAEFDAYVTWRIIQSIDNGVGRGTIYESDGFDRLVNGNAPFDLLTFQCVNHVLQIGEKWEGSGSCVKTDKDGDTIFYTWTNNDWAFTGGTGKFKGITGHGVGKPTYIHDSGARGWQNVVHHVGDWEIK